MELVLIDNGKINYRGEGYGRMEEIVNNSVNINE
jgi:hypothetical protein